MSSPAKRLGLSRAAAASVLFIFAGLLALAGCSGQASVAKQEPKQESKSEPRDALEIAAGSDLLAQIKVGEPPLADVTEAFKVAGRVEADETRMARVSAPVTGRIVDLQVIEGQNVRRGQTLATIHSTDLSVAQSGFLKANSQQQLAERAVARARQLLEAGVIGEAELQRREAELQQINAELSASRDQLKLLGMTDEALVQIETNHNVNAVTPILSSIDGTVLVRKVTIGQVVQAVETIFVVADLSNVWLVADVPEQSAGGLRVAQAVEAEIPALANQRITGTLSFVSSVVSAETRTVRARMDLPNPSLKYKPAMLATMTFLDGGERRRVIPLRALVRENNEDYVFVKTGGTNFLLRPVTLGIEFKETRVLENGIRPTDKIVLDGAYHLNNERKRRALKEQ